MADDNRQRKRRERSSGAKIAARAREELADMTGLEPEGVTALEREEDGAWRVTVEMLELSRVPETDDLLGSYEVELDGDGEMLGYRRLGRYARSQANQPQPTRGS